MLCNVFFQIKNNGHAFYYRVLKILTVQNFADEIMELFVESVLAASTISGTSNDQDLVNVIKRLKRY